MHSGSTSEWPIASDWDTSSYFGKCSQDLTFQTGILSQFCTPGGGQRMIAESLFCPWLLRVIMYIYHCLSNDSLHLNRLTAHEFYFTPLYFRLQVFGHCKPISGSLTEFPFS